MTDRRTDPLAPTGAIAGASARDLQEGTRVRVASGAFAGKSGVVSAVDGKGGVLVVLGQITVKVQHEELEVAPAALRDRPVLPTSHVRNPATSHARNRAAKKPR
jgi:ribosomal protein L24